MAVVCDRSDSMLGVTCDAAALEATFDEWLERSGAAPGSSFASTGWGLAGTEPSGCSRSSQEACLLATGWRCCWPREGGSRLDSTGAPTGSAIAEAVSVAAATLRERDGERELVVLSDLRQVTPGTWNFEVSAPTPGGVRRVAAGERAYCLTSVGSRSGRVGSTTGAHPGAPPFDATLARRVEAVWKRAFEAMGAAGARLDGDCAGDASLSTSRGLAAR